MDEFPLRTPTRVRFGPDRRLTAVLVAAAALVGLLAATADTDGRVLLVLAAAVLLGYAASDVVFAARLTVDRSGIRVRSPFARADLVWSDIERVRADERLRLGLRSVTLEIDAGAQLIVLSKRALGAPPQEVAAIVTAFDPRPR